MRFVVGGGRRLTTDPNNLVLIQVWLCGRMCGVWRVAVVVVAPRRGVEWCGVDSYRQVLRRHKLVSDRSCQDGEQWFDSVCRLLVQKH